MTDTDIRQLSVLIAPVSCPAPVSSLQLRRVWSKRSFWPPSVSDIVVSLTALRNKPRAESDQSSDRRRQSVYQRLTKVTPLSRPSLNHDDGTSRSRINIANVDAINRQHFAVTRDSRLDPMLGGPRKRGKFPKMARNAAIACAPMVSIIRSILCHTFAHQTVGSSA
ncbi:MAG: hypothetical protein L0G27_00305 [Paracoccus sp. (in: a-proteobacteria)]|nr:hypothetical protein [Paracoccus sp. (in: a-proteobacteria)]